MCIRDRDNTKQAQSNQHGEVAGLSLSLENHEHYSDTEPKKMPALPGTYHPISFLQQSRRIQATSVGSFQPLADDIIHEDCFEF